MQTPLIEFENIIKEFSGVRVLHGINAEIYSGEVMGIIGENGAGKSTLLKIASGIYSPTKGQIKVDGEVVAIRNASDAKGLKITMIPQEFNLIPSLNIAENIFLGRELKKNGILNKPAMHERSRQLLAELNSTLATDSLIDDLSVAEKQYVEIAKALSYDSRLLIMDEPTTTLNTQEVEILFNVMQGLCSRGVAIVFISHKLQEIKQVCNRLITLRDGHQVGLDDVDSINEQDIATKMIGRELTDIYPAKNTPKTEVVLDVKNLSVPKILKNFNFHLNKCEVLGFAGLLGAGRTELAESIMGLRKISSGKITVNGVERKIASPAEAVKLKIAYISEDRQGKGLMMNFDIPQNMTLVSLKNYISNGFINKRKERQRAQEYVERFDIKAAGLSSHLINLSGGNQQKVYLSKSMDISPEILILDEPTRGIDVNAKKEIYHFIRSLTNEGVSVIVISSEMEELIGLCNRVIVMRQGEKSGELTQEEINEENIIYLATDLKESGHESGHKSH